MDNIVVEVKDEAATGSIHGIPTMEHMIGMSAGTTKTVRIIDRNEEQAVVAEAAMHMDVEVEALDEEIFRMKEDQIFNKIIKTVIVMMQTPQGQYHTEPHQIPMSASTTNNYPTRAAPSTSYAGDLHQFNLIQNEYGSAWSTGIPHNASQSGRRY